MKLHATTFLLIWVMMSSLPVSAQLNLLIEKAGKARTERLLLYDELTFQLNDDDAGWYRRQILDMDANAQLILLGDTWTPLAEITRIKLKRQRVWPNLIGGALAGGGVTMMLGDAWWTLRGRPEFTQGGLEFGILNIAVGAGLKYALGPIKYKLGDRKRLRVVDLTF